MHSKIENSFDFDFLHLLMNFLFSIKFLKRKLAIKIKNRQIAKILLLHEEYANEII